MTILNDFQRASKSSPCPVCGKPDWCLISRDNPSNPSRVICSRIESSKKYGGAGWLHQFRNIDVGYRPAVQIDTSHRQDLAGLARQYTEAVEDIQLQGVATQLGVSTSTLRRLRIGCAGWAWAFPMVDAGSLVRGIRLRKRDGSKLAVKGGRDGLFIPTELDCDGLLLICEGVTDTAAAIDLGFSAIGRPSCLGGVPQTIEFVRRNRVPEVAVVADRDGPGEQGANSLSVVLRAHVRTVRTITPPGEINDLRQWKCDGATRQNILAAIEAAEPRRLTIRIN